MHPDQKVGLLIGSRSNREFLQRGILGQVDQGSAFFFPVTEEVQ
jgi:hypothetical protein